MLNNLCCNLDSYIHIFDSYHYFKIFPSHLIYRYYNFYIQFYFISYHVLIIFLKYHTPTSVVFISPPVINLLNYHTSVEYAYTMCVSNLVNIGCGHWNIIPLFQYVWFDVYTRCPYEMLRYLDVIETTNLKINDTLNIDQIKIWKIYVRITPKRVAHHYQEINWTFECL